MAKVIRTVSVKDDTGQIVRYRPGDEVPAEHAKLITNPAAWSLGDNPIADETPPEENSTSGPDDRDEAPPLPKARKKGKK